ncbi:MAG: GntR family transcriptional regulator [Bacteroidales bacterium]
MFVALSPAHPDPMYKQVTDQIRDAIASGDLTPGDRLPSVRELSESLNVSTITIKRAYQDLETAGYILTRAGLGSFVGDVRREQLRERKLEELKEELRRIVRTSAKFGISAADVVRLTRQVEGE